MDILVTLLCCSALLSIMTIFQAYTPDTLSLPLMTPRLSHSNYKPNIQIDPHINTLLHSMTPIFQNLLVLLQQAIRLREP